MVGMFINSLPLRVAVTEEPAYSLASRAPGYHGRAAAIRSDPILPHPRLERGAAGMPLFESIVIVQNLPFVASLQERADRLGIESARYLERTHYPLTVTVVPGTELVIKIGFDCGDSISPPSSGRSGICVPYSER